MANPIPGKAYTVQPGDTLSDIAARAYGDPGLWPRIFNANQKNIRSGDQDVVAVGEVLIIPVLPEEEALRSAQTQAGQINDGPELKLEDRIVPVQSLRVFKAMDSIAAGWSATIAWEPGKDALLDQLTAPFFYPKATVKLDGKLQVTGKLYRPKTKKDNDGTSIELYGFSNTIDAVDSTLKPPYEANNTTLLQRCNDLLIPMGIGVEVAPLLDPGGPFDRVIATPTEKKFDHLSKLAAQRRLILSSTPEGNVLITRADLDSPAVGTIEEDVSLAGPFEADFDGRKRFNTYRVIGQGANKTTQKVGIAKDADIPISRFTTITASDALKGEMSDVARWRRNRAAAEALTLPLPVNGWNAPNGEMWRENTRLTLKSKTLRIPDGFTLMIRRVELEWDNKGKNTVLNLIPPSFYSDGETETPW
jgi:prophage tail gpP-like protein